jgi:hypothetical protein
MRVFLKHTTGVEDRNNGPHRHIIIDFEAYKNNWSNQNHSLKNKINKTNANTTTAYITNPSILNLFFVIISLFLGRKVSMGMWKGKFPRVDVKNDESPHGHWKVGLRGYIFFGVVG